jgi:flagellar biosynthetic protein FliP
MKRTVSFLFAAATIQLVILFLFGDSASAAESSTPSIVINTSGSSELSTKEVYTGLKLSLLLSAMVFIPALVMTMTCFPRIAIVLSLTRQALGVGQAPPNQLLMGISLFLTMAIMGPVFKRVYAEAIAPYTEEQISTEEALTKSFVPMREFMLPHTRQQDIALFIEITKSEMPESPEQAPASVIIPAFVISELNTAFQIVFLIYIPFLVLDLVISSVLTSMSMITLPPTVVSLPIKIMLFVLIDGWGLIIGNLVKGFQ